MSSQCLIFPVPVRLLMYAILKMYGEFSLASDTVKYAIVLNESTIEEDGDEDASSAILFQRRATDIACTGDVITTDYAPRGLISNTSALVLALSVLERDEYLPPPYTPSPDLSTAVPERLNFRIGIAASGSGLRERTPGIRVTNEADIQRRPVDIDTGTPSEPPAAAAAAAAVRRSSRLSDHRFGRTQTRPVGRSFDEDNGVDEFSEDLFDLTRITTTY
ncbi:hypothetical protein BCR39DRAFT_50554 [Naematelia encephala]|uniref:Uncharacterized protein n=1 Tax=Naematelia encephala TaxID=71784 RepID=A0A1Y2AGU2_9TREE|nr:hypothetical protein BCR39DRAFT_50554 [Naematelia encephala]